MRHINDVRLLDGVVPAGDFVSAIHTHRSPDLRPETQGSLSQRGLHTSRGLEMRWRTPGQSRITPLGQCYLLHARRGQCRPRFRGGGGRIACIARAGRTKDTPGSKKQLSTLHSASLYYCTHPHYLTPQAKDTPHRGPRGPPHADHPAHRTRQPGRALLLPQQAVLPPLPPKPLRHKR